MHYFFKTIMLASYIYFVFTINSILNCFTVQQVKGSEEMKEKIIAASREARSRPDYPQELLPENFNQSLYLNNYHESHLHSNGMSSFFVKTSLFSYNYLLLHIKFSLLFSFSLHEHSSVVCNFYFDAHIR